MIHLADLFPNAKGFATYATATAKVLRHQHLIPERALYVIVQRHTDKRFLPIVILRSEHVGYAVHIAQVGICVTN